MQARDGVKYEKGAVGDKSRGKGVSARCGEGSEVLGR